MGDWRVVRQTPYEYCEGCKQDIGPECVYELAKPVGDDRNLWRYLCEKCAARFVPDMPAAKVKVAQDAARKREQGKALAERGRNRHRGVLEPER
jgi:hypothetical protein